MKRHFSTIAVLSMLVFPALAQVKVGLKAGGARITHIYDYTDYPTKKYSGGELYIGILTTIPLSEKFLLRPELLYSSWCICDVFNFGPEGYNSINLPIFIGYKPIPKLTLLTGPDLRYLPHFYDVYDFNRFNVGIAGGISYQFWKNFSFDATYSHGLTNLIDREEYIFRDFISPAYKGGRSRSIRLGLAYTFGKDTSL